MFDKRTFETMTKRDVFKHLKVDIVYHPDIEPAELKAETVGAPTANTRKKPTRIAAKK